MSNPRGRTYGRLTILGEAMPHIYKSGRREKKWLARCDCGNTIEALAVNIRAGRTSSCAGHGRGPGMPKGKQMKEVVTYASAHKRVHKLRGKASDYLCVDGCGRWARSWSYDHQDPWQLWELRPGCNSESPYSTSPEHYQPRCDSCHRHLDSFMAKARRVAA